jgi:hypothetical protein
MNFLSNALGFVKRNAGGILCVAIAVRQLVIGDWFGAVISIVVGGILVSIAVMQRGKI